jgi:hypothetical protein
MKKVLPTLFMTLLIFVAWLWPATAYQRCAAFDSRLGVDDSTRVITGALNIREDPSTDADRIRDPLPSGTRLTIVDGPECADDILWWEVSTGDLQGWVAEGLEDEYFLSAPFDPSATANNLDLVLNLLDLTPGAVERFLTCEGGFYEDNGITGRVAYSEDNVPNGGTIRISPTTQVLEVDFPAVCIRYDASVSGSIAAIAPDGSQFQPLVYEYERRDAGNSRQIQLPPIAFLFGGRWQIQAGNFSINVDIVLPDRPYVFYTYADQGAMFVGGLQPNEPFIVSGKIRDDQDALYLEAQADDNGIYRHTLSRVPWVNDFEPNRLYRSVISVDVVGQFGSVYLYEGLAVYDSQNDRIRYSIPAQQAAPIIHEITWGSNLSSGDAQNLIRSWTCPGALAIRINGADLNASAVVSRDVGRQNIYRDPSTNSQVEATVDPGREVSIFGGVQCADRAVWWRTRDGWIMESQNGRYYLEPGG